MTSFRDLANALGTAGFGNAFKKYVVYYDGPPPLTDVCGIGGGDFDRGPAWRSSGSNGCPDVPERRYPGARAAARARRAAGRAPNACTPATDPAGELDVGHPCDSPSDILYPFADGRPLAATVLDFNHDDYYGHAGAGTTSRTRSCCTTWTRRRSRSRSPSPGLVSVSSDCPGVACTAACTTQWDQGTSVTLAADSEVHPRFVRWTGSCTGEADCVLDLNKPAAVTAVFGPSIDPGQGVDERQGARRLLAQVLDDVLGRYAADAARGPGQGLEVRALGRGLHAARA